MILDASQLGRMGEHLALLQNGRISLVVLHYEFELFCFTYYPLSTMYLLKFIIKITSCVNVENNLNFRLHVRVPYTNGFFYLKSSIYPYQKGGGIQLVFL